MNRTYMGHYDGIAADRDFFYTTWTDSRTRVRSSVAFGEDEPATLS